MLTSRKFALSLVFVLATASAATAAPKQPVHAERLLQLFCITSWQDTVLD
jgi:hypothetical protein